MTDTLWTKRILARQLGFETLFTKYFHRCPINVLVVADSFLYFNDEDFGLSDFLGILAAAPYRVNFQIKTAHRSDPGPTRLNGATPNFVFSDASLAGFDQVWLFAADTAVIKDKLAPGEVLAITNFMQAGKGVFATGDHENLGLGMCGEIPRVRSMRNWYYPGASPLGEPAAPSGSSADRHDTNRPGRNTAFSFDDQSDSIPQEITPKLYTRQPTKFIVERYPHPLLCGPHGAIRVLPDHPHEGECVVPAVLDRSLDVGPVSSPLRITEYPLDSSGARVVPEVIATSRMLAGAEVPEAGKPPIAGGTFGAIGAYDGHRASVGRVVVDATWHHFININLTGAAGGSDSEKRVGFLHAATLTTTDPERLRIERDYEQIQAYFQNIGTWLAPASKQQCLNRWALRYVSRSYPLLEELATLKDRKLDFDDHVRIGASGYAALRSFTRRCTATKIQIDLLWPPLRRWPIPIDPWNPPGPRPGPDPSPIAFDLRALELANLGAVLVELHRIEEGPNPDAQHDALQKAEAVGQRKGAALVAEALAQHTKAMANLVKLAGDLSSKCDE